MSNEDEIVFGKLEEITDTPSNAEVEPTEDSVEQSLSDINSLLLKQELRVSKTQTLREQLLDKLTTDVMNMDLDTSGHFKCSDMLAKTSILSAYTSLLNDIESADRQLISTKLKMKNSENESKSAINAADFLSKIGKAMQNGGTVTFDNPDATDVESPAYKKKLDDEFNKAFSRGELVILDDELEIGGAQLPRVEVGDTDE